MNDQTKVNDESSAEGQPRLNSGLGDMTLLDYFAVQALPSVMVIAEDKWYFDFSDAFGDKTCHSDHIAMAAYAFAEAMLRARNHKFYVSPNVQIEGQPASGLSHSNAGLDTGKEIT